MGLYTCAGDVAVLVAACFYSLLTVRIGRYARQAAPVRLASSKSSALAAIALASLAVLAVKRGLSGEGVTSLWGNPFDLVALGAITWAALGPGAGAAFLQSKVGLPQLHCSASSVPCRAGGPVLGCMYGGEDAQGEWGARGK